RIHFEEIFPGPDPLETGHDRALAVEAIDLLERRRMRQRVVDLDIATALQVRTALADQAQGVKRGKLVVRIRDGQVVVVLVIDQAPIARGKLVLRDLEGVPDTRIRAVDLLDWNPDVHATGTLDRGPVV